MFFFLFFDHFPFCSSNGQSRCRWLPNHWSPVIIICRQPVLMSARPWEKPFLFMKEKTGSKECWMVQLRIHMQEDAGYGKMRFSQFVVPLIFQCDGCVCYSRHDERLLSRLSQHAVHKQRRVGETVLVPLASFIKAQPEKTHSCWTKNPR